MKIVSGTSSYAQASGDRPAPPPLAIAIGNFDGVHLGHAALLAEARRRAARRGCQSAVLTFTPHPARLFAPERAPALIMSLERRLELCAEAGIDVAIVEPFTHAFAAIEAAAFVTIVLARYLGACDAVVGYDFSFGRGRSEDAGMLYALGAEVGIDVGVIRPVTVDGVACSSTRVRELVAAGETAAAARLLGRPFELQGPVARGAGRGRGLGFPTANVIPDSELRPKLGIYAARARVLDGPLAGTTRAAALSVGTNPTFKAEPSKGSEPPATGSGGQSPPSPTRSSGDTVTIEAYLLDFDGDLYDRRVRLEVGERLRDEQRFESVAALVAQIREDVAQVRRLSS